jgi:hypothetical protein
MILFDALTLLPRLESDNLKKAFNEQEVNSLNYSHNMGLNKFASNGIC